MEERRKFVRFSGKGFIAQIGTALYNVVNLSVSGIKIENAVLPLDSVHVIKLIPRTENNLELNDAKIVEIKVVRIEQTAIGCSFTKPTFNLMKTIVSHKSEEVGHPPYFFK